MEREEVLVRFSDLRRLASSILGFVADRLGADSQPTFLAAIEDDFGIVGLDTESLLVEFGETYRVDLSRFDFTGCISPEPTGNPLIMLLIPPFITLYVLAWVANAVAALCYAPFSLPKAQLMLKAGIGDPATIARELLFPPTRPRPAAQILTTGDLVASAATGYFVKRERVRFVLAK